MPSACYLADLGSNTGKGDRAMAMQIDQFSFFSSEKVQLVRVCRVANEAAAIEQRVAEPSIYFPYKSIAQKGHGGVEVLGPRSCCRRPRLKSQ